MVEHNRENCERLAKAIVETMELDDLIEYAEEVMSSWYELACPQELWEEDCEIYLTDEEQGE